MKKIDLSIVVEVVGASLAAAGLAMISIPLALERWGRAGVGCGVRGGAGCDVEADE